MKIISGGQTGVDTAALYTAINLSLPYGGWVPKGRTNEDGPISNKFTELREANSSDNKVRTILNVQDADTLLVLTEGSKSSGTQLAIEEAHRLKIPVKIIVLSDCEATLASQQIIDFLREQKPEVLNIAGPRESEAKGICKKVQTILEDAIRGY